MLLNPPRESTDGGLGSLSNDHSSSNSFDVFKSYTFTTTPFCYGWLKLNSLSTSIVAINLKYQNTITIAGTFAKALLRVVLLVSARSMSLVPPSTPLCLLTMANCSSSDSLLQEASRNFDLTCTIKLLNFWLKALKDPLLINFIYPFIFLLVTLTEENDKLREKEREIESRKLAEADATALKEKSRMEYEQTMNMMKEMLEHMLKQSNEAHKKELDELRESLKQGQQQQRGEHLLPLRSDQVGCNIL
ncbi:hypothetical protein ISN45_At01g033630 [Arabidopsis thaliana x Arabidopsis arenosa]|uniref:Uncharacterized protein n=2 Tax=Arabidopsis TaxID=3701 RepID=A0A178W5B8_ARATH|nr:hypothetical protein ISN45_At01g033630 [Arabidopsis thaliana x Arabidopsis arenosa]OAP12553.1 hypothetical protein AXX17_AT1G34670 [Arabidopsis thaliana]